jgi:hypothetical protein
MRLIYLYQPVVVPTIGTRTFSRGIARRRIQSPLAYLGRIHARLEQTSFHREHTVRTSFYLCPNNEIRQIFTLTVYVPCIPIRYFHPSLKNTDCVSEVLSICVALVEPSTLMMYTTMVLPCTPYAEPNLAPDPCNVGQKNLSYLKYHVCASFVSRTSRPPLR